MVSPGAYGLWIACPNWTPEKGNVLESDSDSEAVGKVLMEGPEHDELWEALALCPVPEAHVCRIKSGASQPHPGTKPSSFQRIWKWYSKQQKKYIVSCFKLVIKKLLVYSSVECKLKTQHHFSEWEQEDPKESWEKMVWLLGWLGHWILFLFWFIHSFIHSFVHWYTPPSFHPSIHASLIHLSTSSSVYLSIYSSLHLFAYPFTTHHLSIIHPSCHPLTHF